MKTIINALLLLAFAQTVLADEGGLSLPKHSDDAVTLTLKTTVNDTQNTADLLQVYVGDKADCCQGKTPIAGRYHVDGKTINFTPTFDFVTGQDYVIRVTSADNAPQLTAFSLKSPTPMTTPTVTAVYPRGDSLPENVLRFYLHFSTPMQPHVAFDHIKLVDADGNIDDAAFMRFKQELWNADRTRLTLLMDPGRIKRGVATNERLGAALHAGQDYKLVIDGGWQTANGQATLPRFEKVFHVTKALRTLPNVDNWQVSAPKIGSQQALKITFDRPFDYELLRSKIHVLTPDGEPIQGNITTEDNESTWLFHPESTWQNEQITLVVDATLEDVAANNFKDLLDHSVADGTKAVQTLTIDVTLIK